MVVVPGPPPLMGAGRPILGTALVLGASHHIARREAERQMSAQEQREWEIERRAEERRRQEREQEARVQRAVDEAMKTANAKNANASAPGNQYVVASPVPVATAVPLQPTQAVYQGAPRSSMLDVGDTLAPPPSYTPRSVSPGAQPGPVLVPDTQNVQYCPACGNACELGDRFCRKCGTKQACGG